ncbi:MAG TPA: RNA-binding protein [Vicinamibacterales bacterium]|jgi:RNA recognition motif-containing protein|nr:RNA-binding protein [Vicinamibacterales bacterium]
MNLKLYVGNLAFSTEENAIQSLFAQAGPVQSVNLIRDRATGQSRGFAFVEMETEDGARTAIDQFHERELDGRRLTVNEARPQAPRGDFGGNGGGRGRSNGGGGFGGGGGNRRREPRW